MARLFIRVHWEGVERKDAEARKRVVEHIIQRFPSATETGWTGFPEDLTCTELRVEEVKS